MASVCLAPKFVNSELLTCKAPPLAANQHEVHFHTLTLHPTHYTLHTTHFTLHTTHYPATMHELASPSHLLSSALLSYTSWSTRRC